MSHTKEPWVFGQNGEIIGSGGLGDNVGVLLRIAALEAKVRELETTWLSKETYETLMQERQETLHDLTASRQQVERLANELGELIELADYAMQQANNDGAEYDRAAELRSAREALAAVGKETH